VALLVFKDPKAKWDYVDVLVHPVLLGIRVI
jgi:hypothetical protein